MNLQSKRARIPVAALGAAALCAGGISLSPAAYAAGSLTISPGTTNVTTLDLGSQAAVNGTGYTLAQALANATYATHVTSTGLTTLTLSVDGYTAPTGVTTGTPYFFVAEKATGGTTGPTVGGANGPWTRVTAPASGGTAVTVPLTVAAGASANDVFMTAAAPGTYTVHFVDGGTQAGTDDDSVSPSMTLNVKDVGAITGDTSDDFAPAVQVPSSVGIGAPVKATADLSSLTLADSRGTSSGTGELGKNINSLLSLAFSGTAGATIAAANGTFSASSTSVTVPVGTTTTAGTVISTLGYNKNGDVTLGDSTVNTATTNVTSNSVTSLTLNAHDVTGSIASTGTAVAVKVGQGPVTYEAKVANTTTPTDIAGKDVYFTIGGTAVQLAKLTTDGTAVDTSGTLSKIYSSKTDSNGMATLKVTSSTAADTETYTVKAASNGSNSVPATLTATYAPARASTVKVTSTASDLTVAPSGAAPIKAAIYDQFGSAVMPSASDSQQAQLYVGSAASSCTAPTIPATTVSATQNATVSGGNISFTYTPASAPTAGQCIRFAVGYDADKNGNISVAESATGQINYTSATAAANITLAAPAEGSAQTLQTHTAVGAGTAVTGTVTDATNGTVAFKPVVLTGDEGVFFSTVANPAASDATDDLKSSITVVTDGSGNYTAYAFWLDNGTKKVTATSGTATKSVSVKVSDPIDPFRIIVDDVTGSPGDTIVVTGKVLDMFDNPVPTNQVGLSVGGSTVGTLASTTVTTNSEGIFSTSFTTGSNQSGDVTLTGTLYTHGGVIMTSSAGLVPAAAWKANAGLTYDNGNYQDTGKITVQNITLVLDVPATSTAGGNGALVKLGGSFKANTSVDIYARETGAAGYQLIDTATTDDEGDYGLNVRAYKTSSYLARSQGVSSAAHTNRVVAHVTITAKALGGGKVRISANGDPNVAGTLRFYRSVSGTDPKLATVSTKNGLGTATVSLPKKAVVLYATFDAGGISQGRAAAIKVTVK